MIRIAGDRRWSSRRALCATVVVLVLAALGVLPRAADARVRRPITLRIEGFLDTAPEGVRAQRTIEVRIGRETTRSLAVTAISNQSQGPHGVTILNEVARYRPAFRLLGDADLVTRLAAAPKGARVTLAGNLSSGRNVLLTIADVAPAPAPAAAASPAP
jgi:hypothetical protein